MKLAKTCLDKNYDSWCWEEWKKIKIKNNNKLDKNVTDGNMCWQTLRILRLGIWLESTCTWKYMYKIKLTEIWKKGNKCK